MSQSSMAEAQRIQSYQDTLITNYILVMAISLFVYDTIISFNLECRAVWTHKITRATALYLALRYVTLGNVITCLLEFILPSCEIGTLCGTYLAQAAFASIRVYAIDGRQWTKAIIAMMLGLVPVAINIIFWCSFVPGSQYDASKAFMYSTAEVCNIHYPFSTFKSDALFLVTRICVLISNLLVVVSTWQAAHHNRRVGAWNSRGSLIAVLFRDGTIHFALVVVLNAANIASGLLTSLSNRLSSTIFGNLGEMFEVDPQALDDELDHELDERPGAGQSDSTNYLPNGAKAPSTSRMTTTASCRLDTYEKPAADCELLAAPDVGIDPRMTDIV
ncbi:predicted protein [Postia placenta Mad-698-R]|nr:predicted protein [Postia placenta Mad-698-R]